MDKLTSQPKFPDLPIEVQVALINAASNMAATKIAALGKYNSDCDFFGREYHSEKNMAAIIDLFKKEPAKP